MLHKLGNLAIQGQNYKPLMGKHWFSEFCQPYKGLLHCFLHSMQCTKTIIDLNMGGSAGWARPTPPHPSLAQPILGYTTVLQNSTVRATGNIREDIAIIKVTRISPLQTKQWELHHVCAIKACYGLIQSCHTMIIIFLVYTETIGKLAQSRVVSFGMYFWLHHYPQTY